MGIEKSQRFSTGTRARRRGELAFALGVTPDELPEVFTLDKPKVLSLGIYQEMMRVYPRADAALLQRWLSWYCNSCQYLSRLKRGWWRHNLQGEHVTPLTPEEKAHAKVKLNERYQAVARQRQQVAA